MKVLGNRVVATVSSEKGEIVTASGIIIQENSIKDTNKALRTAEIVTILQLGNKLQNKDLKIGSVIAIEGKSGHKQEVEGQEVLILREPAILAIIE